MKVLKFTVLLFAVLCCNLMAKAQETYSVAVGASVYANAVPRTAGNLSVLVRLDEAGNSFSFTTLEARGSTTIQPVYSTRTGYARLIQKSKLFSLYALGTGGVATSGDATSGAFSGGGLAAFGITRNLQVLVGVQALGAPTAGGWNPQVTVAFRLLGD